MPGCRHSFADSPRSPNERQTTTILQPREAYKAIAPPARHTKSAECALTTTAVRFFSITIQCTVRAFRGPKHVYFSSRDCRHALGARVILLFSLLLHAQGPDSYSIH